jgi:hypothetical protein
MALPLTLHQEKNNPFPIEDPTSPHDNISAAAAMATTIPLTATIDFVCGKTLTDLFSRYRVTINNQQTTRS